MKKLIFALMFMLAAVSFAGYSGGGGTVSEAQLATKADTNDVALLESKVDGLINNGTFLYNCSTTNTVNTNYFNLCSTLNAKFSRTYTALTNNQYVGDLMTTQKYTRVNGPAVMSIYLERVNASPVAPALSVKPEIYFSETGTNNWFGDYDTQAQAITTGTNLYTFVVHFPQQIATNTAGFYVRRALKVTSVNNANLVVHGGTGTPSSVSFTVPASSTDFIPQSSITPTLSGDETNAVPSVAAVNDALALKADSEWLISDIKTLADTTNSYVLYNGNRILHYTSTQSGRPVYEETPDEGDQYDLSYQSGYWLFANESGSNFLANLTQSITPPLTDWVTVVAGVPSTNPATLDISFVPGKDAGTVYEVIVLEGAANSVTTNGGTITITISTNPPQATAATYLRNGDGDFTPDDFVKATQVSQATGTNTDDVMSQNATTLELATKPDATNGTLVNPTLSGTNYIYNASATNAVYSYWDSAATQKVTKVIINAVTNTYISLNN